ncbi:uncharacterized protein LOC142523050 [Primulina tabacum]|uniref:uncharacterized protein LOC142523050 n=1 Tax=Primulina tabacum TaxID=48773 RepID=UPI003F5AA3EA
MWLLLLCRHSTPFHACLLLPVMARGRKPRPTSAFVSSEMLDSSSSCENTLSTTTGCAIGSSSIGRGCLSHFTEQDIDHLQNFPVVPKCRYCGAWRFPHESPTFCCGSGKIQLTSPIIPSRLRDLFTDISCPSAILFRRKIRLYNSLFSFTSFVVRLDKDLASLNRGVYTFRVSGQVFHSLPPLVPSDDGPKYFQLYFWDSDNELRNRISVVGEEAVNESTMALLMDILKVNPYAQLLKRIKQYPSVKNLRLHICKDVSIDHRLYNSPSADQVAAIWVEGNDNANIPYDRDIVVHAYDGHMHMIKPYFGCYDLLQYPLFFPYGDVGWQQHIWKSGIDHSPASFGNNLASTSGFPSLPQYVGGESRAIIRGKNDRMVSCREYYCYRIQIRDNDSSILLYGGRLLQQYIVDMYIKLETTRLDYYRRNQTEIRSEMYQGIVDSVVGGETRGSEIGHRIVLPTSFIGGPRDMRKRYLDDIALVKAFGKPDLFLTITCNPEWKEIKENLFDGQVAHDRPDLVSRVFRSKLIDLKDKVLKKCIFGRVAAYVYVIEFQKRGLPHASYLIH